MSDVPQRVVRARALPLKPDLEHLKSEAKLLLATLRKSAPEAKLADAQFHLACEYGFSSWRALKDEIDVRSDGSDVGQTATPEEIAQRRAEQALPRSAIPFDPAMFDKYVGYYQLGPSSIFTITRDGDRFNLRLTGQVSVEVYPESNKKFFAKVVPAQISFSTDPQDNVTELVLHQSGAEQHAKRISATLAKDMEAALERRQKSNTPSAGAEATLRRHIEGLEKGQPDYDAMSLALAALTRQQMPSLQQLMKRWGALLSITFKAVSRQGWDIYEVTFEHAQTEWRITPPGDDGKITGLGVRELP